MRCVLAAESGVTQAVQLSASARVIAAGLSRAPHKAGKSGIIEREHAPQCLARSRRDRTMRYGCGLTILVACLERALNAGENSRSIANNSPWVHVASSSPGSHGADTSALPLPLKCHERCARPMSDIPQ